MGHGCTNYDWFGEKELAGIGWVWGLDRNWMRQSSWVNDTNNAKEWMETMSGRNGPTQAKSELELATRLRSGFCVDIVAFRDKILTTSFGPRQMYLGSNP